MWIYYGLILISVVMFGGGFAIQDQYRKKRGSGLLISMESACIGAFAGLIILFAFNKFSISFTLFTFLMASWAALNGLAFTFCAFKALDYINLSLFSLFAMLGGMVLPFLQGIIFYAEGFTLAKAICIVFVCASLLCTIEKGEKKNGTIFYLGIFVLNGMAGVISKLFTSSNMQKTGAMDYSIWIAIVTVVFSGIAWLVLVVMERRGKSTQNSDSIRVDKKDLITSYALGAANGVINRVANLLLVFALAFVDTSVQYPMVTGGTMIVSTVISCFGEKKPNKREIIGVGLAFIGMCALFFIPI